jgi:rhomboid protease GluP
MRQKPNRNLPSSMPCPNCRRLISMRTERCIHCGYRFPQTTASIPFLNDLARGNISFVTGIIVACFVLYLLALGLDFTSAFQVDNLSRLFAPSAQSLLKLGMGGYIPLLRGQWWTLLTATYLHGSILHILFNMLWLRQLGPLVEELYGASRFIVIYTIAGLSGALVSALIGHTPFFVGASGAVFGLFGALIYYGLRRGGTFGTGLFRQMILWAVIGLALGFMNTGVDNLGHIGGIVGGSLAAIIMGYQEQRRQSLGNHLTALVVMVFIGVCFAFMLVNFFLG